MRSDLPNAEDFQDWVCGEVLPSIRKHGLYATPQTIDAIINDPDFLIRALTELKNERAEKERLLLTTQDQARIIEVAQSKISRQVEIIEIKNDEIKGLLPDAEYTRETLRSVSTFTTTQIAKELGMSAKALNKKLCDMKIQFKVNEQWILYAKYQGKGYTETTTYTETVNDVTKTYHLTVWTEKGRKFIFELLKVEAAA